MARSRKGKAEPAVEDTSEPTIEAAEPTETEAQVAEPAAGSDETPLAEAAAADGAGDVADGAAEAAHTGDVDSGTSDDEPATPESEPAPEPEAEAPAPALQPERRRGGFMAPALGGVVAAGLGFGLATYVMPSIVTPALAPEDLAALRSQVEAQDSRIGALGAEIEALTSDTSVASAAEAQAAANARMTEELSSISARLQGLDEQLAQATAAASALEERVTTLEKRPTAEGAASASALEAFGREMDDLRKAVDARQAETAAAEQKIAVMTEEAAARLKSAEEEAARQHEMAAEATRQAAVRAAIGRVRAALESGGSLDSGLADLAAAGVEPPAVLTDQAQGVPSLAALRDGFPVAARDALAASLRENAAGNTWDRVTAFLRSQSGARSLTPRAGDDPDAILSRAEAAVRAGDLAMAIDEIGKLPEDGQARMAEWAALAKRRMAATDAVSALAAENE